MSLGVEIIDFYRPDSNRKNLFITNIPAKLYEDDLVVTLREIFEQYGLVYGVQVYPTQWKPKSESDQTSGEISSGYYAFVTFFSAMEAARAKDDLRNILILAETECKIAFAKRKKDVSEKVPLYFTRCYELMNNYLGFNSWSTEIKTLFEDKDSLEETESTKTVRYVCLVQLTVRDLNTEGVGVWQETYNKADPLSKIQATCRCKKLCHQRAIENAFSRVLLIYLSNGKVSVEIDTTKPEFRTDVIKEDQLIKRELLKRGEINNMNIWETSASAVVRRESLFRGLFKRGVNDLDIQPESEADMEEVSEVNMSSKLSASDIDDINLQILQELEEEM